MWLPRWACPEVATRADRQLDDGEQAARVVGVFDADPPWQVRPSRAQQDIAAGVEVVVHAELDQVAPAARAAAQPLTMPDGSSAPRRVDIERSPGEPAGDLGEVQHLGDRGVGIPDRAAPGAGSG